jgi:excinuclease ABC subunit A
MTELNDHLKLLFARTAQLFCRGCGRMVHRDTPDSIYAELVARAQATGDPRLIVTFPVTVPRNFTDSEGQETARSAGLHAHPSAGKRRNRDGAGPFAH